jgi:hypothetical protein
LIFRKRKFLPPKRRRPGQNMPPNFKKNLKYQGHVIKNR